jgi:chaperonin GroES
MNCFVFAVVLINLINIASAFKPASKAGFCTFSSLLANKLDGISIDGDLAPLANNLLIKVKEAATSTKGGLYIPDNAKERPTEGLVIGAGPGLYHPETGTFIANAVQDGDGVVYGKYDGTQMKYNEANHQLIKDDDVLLRYEGDEATFANCQPVKDSVLIRLPEKEEKNSAGIIINSLDSKDKKIDYGTVAKVGPGKQAATGVIVPILVEVGDGVRFRDNAGSDIKIEGIEYRVLKAYNILAKWVQ